jgi:hypothetical protein
MSARLSHSAVSATKVSHFDRAGRFVRAELNGRLTTDTAVLEVQLGIEHRGPATAADAPHHLGRPTTSPTPAT